MENRKWKIKNGIANTRRGQSVVEILVALGILVAGLASAVMTLYGGQSLTLDAGESSAALRLAREGIESSVASSYDNFNGLASSTSAQGEFTKQISVTQVDSNTKQITSTVSWHTDPLRTQTVSLTTLVTNWQSSVEYGGDTGGGGISGNWGNPQTLGSINLGPGENPTDLDVINKIVYMSSVASDSKKPDFFVIDATNGQSPVIVSSLDTGQGLNAVDAAGQYAYAAQDDEKNQLQIVDISNISSPSLTASFNLPGISGANGTAVFYDSSKVYVGTEQANGPELHVVNVANPASPSELGSFEVGADVNKIFVAGGTAYLATSAGGAQVKILDVSNPSAIKLLGSYALPGGGDAKTVYLVGTTLYVGRASGSGNEFLILDVSNPASPKLLGSAATNGDLNGIRVRDSLAFLGTANSNDEFQVWNVANPAQPSLVSELNFPEVVTGIDYESNIVYTSVRSNDGLRIITSQ